MNTHNESLSNEASELRYVVETMLEPVYAPDCDHLFRVYVVWRCFDRKDPLVTSNKHIKGAYKKDPKAQDLEVVDRGLFSLDEAKALVGYLATKPHAKTRILEVSPGSIIFGDDTDSTEDGWHIYENPDYPLSFKVKGLPTEVDDSFNFDDRSMYRVIEA